jgi:hypothetical protein
LAVITPPVCLFVPVVQQSYEPESDQEESIGPYSCPHRGTRSRALDLYKQHIKAIHEGNKLADIAEANQSGNGLLDK